MDYKSSKKHLLKLHCIFLFKVIIYIFKMLASTLKIDNDIHKPAGQRIQAKLLTAPTAFEYLPNMMDIREFINI